MIGSESSGLTARQAAAVALKCARALRRRTSTEDVSRSLPVRGAVGTGKDLSLPLHRQMGSWTVLGHSASLYLTAFELFELLSGAAFGGDRNE